MQLRNIAVTLVALAAVAGAAAFAVGFDRIWAGFGPADLGGVDFATFERRSTPNDALACRPEICAAKADVESPLFDIAAPALLRMVETAVAGEPRLEKVSGDDAQGTLRYVQRSQIFRFPDTINVKVVSLPDGRSTVLLYSRSQIGKGDMGVNRARIERWIELIRQQAGKT